MKDSVAVKRITSNNDGRFELSHGIKGNYHLVVSYTGYHSYTSPVFALANKDLGTIQLSTANTLTDVTVQNKQGLVSMEGGNLVYNVAKSIDAQGLSAFDVLKKAPGVYIDNETTITLNGKQGVLIMMDGKQTYLSGRELTDLLKAMPSSGIRSIEIINSPGAKYDAAGSAGIINVRTLKNIAPGFNGNASVGLAYGIKLRQNQDVSFNYRRGKLNVFGSYNHFVGHYQYAYGSDRIQSGQIFNSFTDDTDKRARMGARLGVDYSLDKKQTIGVLINSNFIFGGGITTTRTDIDPASSATRQVLDAENDYYYQQTNRYNLNLNYKYEDAKGRLFNVDADYGTFNKGNANLQSNIYSKNQSVLNSYLYRTLNDIDIDMKGIKIDYTTNLLKGVLETGVKFSGIVADNGSRFYHVKTDGDSVDARRSNTFTFDEQIGAAYVNYKRTIGKWSFQAGLRAEQTTSNGTLLFKHNGTDSTETIDRSFLDFFPSFNISLKAAKFHNVSLAYSRRIDRPAYQDLNPFVYLLDELSFWQGNPFLQPQLTHRIGLQYAYKSATVVVLTYAHSDGYLTRITDTIDGNKILMVPRNVGVQQNISLALTQTIAPKKWWDITVNGSVYHLRNKVSLDQYRQFDLDQLAGRMNVVQSFKLPRKFIAEVTTNVVSRRLTGANDVTRGINTLDLALQKKIIKNRGTLRLVFNDIYKGSKANSIQSYTGFYLRSYGYYETRQVRMSFAYKFADNSVKGPRARNSSLENESGRIK